MRILIINQYFPPDASNTAYILGELAEDLARVHDVMVVSGTPSYNSEASRFEPAGVTVLRVASTSFSRRSMLGRALNYASFLALSLLRACSVQRPDVVVAMTDPPFIGLVGAIVSLRYKRPFVHICHDLYPDIAIALGKLDNRLIIRSWNLLNRLVWKRASAISVVGRDMKTKLARTGNCADKIKFIPTWSSEYKIEDDAVSKLRQIQGWADRFIVMHAGNMGLAQNLTTFVDVAKNLVSQERILLVFVGDGAGKPALVEAVVDAGLKNVAFLPHCPKDEAQMLMAAADLHVVSLVPGLYGCATPSKTYGIMAAGRPFVAAVDADSELHQIVEEFECGIHVEPGNPEKLTEAINSLANNDQLKAMGERAKNALAHRYHRTHATNSTRALLEEVESTSRVCSVLD